MWFLTPFLFGFPKELRVGDINNPTIKAGEQLLVEATRHDRKSQLTVEEGGRLCVINNGAISTPTNASIIVRGLLQLSGVSTLQANIIVEESGRIEVAPGTELLMGQDCSIAVRGHLKIVGAPTKRIRISGIADGAWGNLHTQGGNASLHPQCVTVRGGRGHPWLGDSQNRIGGAVMAIETSRVHLEDVEFCHNSAAKGGALYLRGCTTAQVVRCAFLDNRASGALKRDSAGGAIFAHSTTLRISGCRFVDNESSDPSGCGGAVYVGLETMADLRDTRFERNKANNAGAAIYSIALAKSGDKPANPPTKVDLQNDCVFLHNVCASGRQSIFFDEGTTARLAHIQLEGDRIWAGTSVGRDSNPVEVTRPDALKSLLDEGYNVTYR